VEEGRNSVRLAMEKIAQLKIRLKCTSDRFSCQYVFIPEIKIKKSLPDSLMANLMNYANAETRKEVRIATIPKT
jgi:hypothetical protein